VSPGTAEPPAGAPAAGPAPAARAADPTGGWVETCRGAVFAWEVDTVGHFTVAYYFERFMDATLGALATLGLGPAHAARTGRGGVTEDCHVRYLHELRAGDVLHVESGVLDVAESALRLGHKLFDSATGELCATVEQHVAYRILEDDRPARLDAAVREAARARRVPWDGPARERRPRPVGAGGFLDGARDTVKPWELDVHGRSALPYYIHRFSSAGLRTFAAFGMTPAYMREQHRGFSTFEFQFRLRERLRAGDLVRVRTCVAHVGSSSIRVFHRMLREPGEVPVAELDQFGVHLDMDARRPVPLPEALRERARALRAEVTLEGDGGAP
jgi:acyl-CoA thioesterase FadM